MSGFARDSQGNPNPQPAGEQQVSLGSAVAQLTSIAKPTSIRREQYQ